MKETIEKLLDHPRSLPFVVLLGFLVRFIAIAMLAAVPFEEDAGNYFQMALTLARGVRFEPEWPPGVAYMLLPFVKVLGEAEIVARFVMVGLHGVFAFLLYKVVTRIVSRRAAVLALGLLAIAPTFAFVSVTPMTQLPTATLLLLIVWLIVELLEKKQLWVAVLLGLAMAGVILVRPSNGLLCVGLGVFLLWRIRSVKVLAPLVLAGTILIAAWTLRAHEACGRWVFVNTANSRNFYYGNNPWTPHYKTWWFGSHKYPDREVPLEFAEDHNRADVIPRAERDKWFSREATNHIKDRPDLFVVRSLSRVRTFFAFDTFAGAQVAKKANKPLLGFAIIGVDGLIFLIFFGLTVVRLFRGKLETIEHLISVSIGLYAVPYFISFSHPTYHFPIVPLLAILGLGAFAPTARGSKAGEGGVIVLPTEQKRRHLLYAALFVVLAIQVEWVIRGR